MYKVKKFLAKKIFIRHSACLIYMEYVTTQVLLIEGTAFCENEDRVYNILLRISKEHLRVVCKRSETRIDLIRVVEWSLAYPCEPSPVIDLEEKYGLPVELNIGFTMQFQPYADFFTISPYETMP